MQERRRALLAATSSAKTGNQRDIETPKAPHAESLSQSRRDSDGADESDRVVMGILPTDSEFPHRLDRPVGLTGLSVGSPPFRSRAQKTFASFVID
jgi:hypothetical protein